jgi:hypothetical protein
VPEGNIDAQIGGICFTLRNGPAQDAPSCLKRIGPSIPVVPGTSYKGNRYVYAAQTFGGAVLLSRALAILQKTPPTPKFECVQRLEGECIKFVPLASSRQNPS